MIERNHRSLIPPTLGSTVVASNWVTRAATLVAIFLLLTVLAGFASQAVSEGGPPGKGWIPFNSTSPAPPSMALFSSGPTYIDLTAEFPGVFAETVKVEGEDGSVSSYLRLYGEGFGVGELPGYPDLPVLRRDVEIPFGARPTVEILDANNSEVSLAELGWQYQVMPLQPSRCKCEQVEPFRINHAAYSAGHFSPEQPVRIAGEYIVRGHRVLVLEVWPVAYNPTAGRLLATSRIQLRIRLSGTDLDATRLQSTRYASPAFETRLSREILNYNQGEGARSLQPGSAPAGFLIITPDSFYNSLLPLVTLKQSQGFATTITRLSDIPGGGSSSGIKAYIQDAYVHWPIPPSYVLLAGDPNNGVDSLPGWPGVSASQVTDLYYGTMDGESDWIPDIARGRLPARSPAQMEAMVAKILAYASATGAEPWVKKGSFWATCDRYWIAEASHNYAISTYTLGRSYSGSFPAPDQPGGDQLYCVSNGATLNNVISSVNEGRAFTIYSGHGSQSSWELGFDQAQVRNLNPQAIYPFIASHACLTNDFEEQEVFGETWMVQPGKGSISFWGSSDNSYWDEDDRLERAMFDALYQASGDQPTIGSMTDEALASVQSIYPAKARYYWEIYNLLGDPSLELLLGPRTPDFGLSTSPETAGICNSGTVTSTIAVSSQLGYSSPVSLSLAGLPASGTVGFSTNPVNPPGSSLLTLEAASIPPGSYPLQVIGASAEYSHTTSLDLSVFSAPPANPRLTFPPNGAGGLPVRPTFTWTDSGESGTYEIEISTDPDFSTLADSASGLLSSSYAPSADLQSGSIYYWRVRASNACGESSYSLVNSFATQPLPGDCPLGSTSLPVYSQDFENGAAGWTHSGVGETWTITNQRKNTGNFSYHAQDLPTSSDQRLNSPSISLPPGQLPLSLQFWNFQDMEDRSGGCYDGSLLEISLDGGASWTQLESQLLTDGYDGPVSNDLGNPLGARNAWCGNPRDWARVVASLDEYAGQTIQARLRLGTDSSVGFEGWYIDDFTVQSCLAGYRALLGPNSLVTSLPGSRQEHSFQLMNFGLSDIFTLTVASSSWPVRLLTPSPLAIGQASTGEVYVEVEVPPTLNLPLGQTSTFTLTAVSRADPSQHLVAYGETSLVYTPRILASPEWQARLGAPGELITHTFTITNTGGYTDTFQLAPDPGQWLLNVQGSIGSLGPQDAFLVQVGVQIPNLPGGSHQVISDTFHLRIASGWNGAEVGEVSGTTYGNLAPGVTLFASSNSSGTKGAVVGSSATYTLTVQNTGNYPDRFFLDSQSTWPVSLEMLQTPLLSPGEIREILLQVMIPEKIKDGESGWVTVKARSSLDPATQAQVDIQTFGWWLRTYLPYLLAGTPDTQ